MSKIRCGPSAVQEVVGVIDSILKMSVTGCADDRDKLPESGILEFELDVVYCT